MEYLSEQFKSDENDASLNLLNEQSQHESLLYDDQSFDSEAADMFGCAVSPEEQGRIQLNFSIPGDNMRNSDDRMKAKTPSSVSPAKYYAQSFHQLDDLINERRAELSALRKKNKQKILEKLLELKSPTSAQQPPSLQLGGGCSFKSPQPTTMFVSVSTGTNTDLGLSTDDSGFGPGTTGIDMSGGADSAVGMRSRPPRSSSSGGGGKTLGSGGGMLPLHVVGVAAIPRGSPLYTGRSKVKEISTPQVSRFSPIDDSEDGDKESIVNDDAYVTISELEKELSEERQKSTHLLEKLGMAEGELATLTERLRSLTLENVRLDERNKQLELSISSRNGGGIPGVPVLQSVDGFETTASEVTESFSASISGECHHNTTFTASIQDVGETMVTPPGLLSELETHGAQSDIVEVMRQLAELQRAYVDLENDLMLATRSALDWEAHAAALSTHFQPLLDEAEAQRLQLAARCKRGANVLLKLLCMAWGDKERLSCLLCFRTLALFAARQRYVSLAPPIISTPLKTQGRNNCSINGLMSVQAVPNNNPNSSTVANLFGDSPSKPSSTSIVSTVSTVSAPHLVPAVTAAAVSSQSPLATVSRLEAVQVSHMKLAQMDAASRLETRRRNINFLISLAFYQTIVWVLLLALSSFLSRTPTLADLQYLPRPFSVSCPPSKLCEPLQCICPLFATSVEELGAAPAKQSATDGTSDSSKENVAGVTGVTGAIGATGGSVTGSAGYSFPLSRDPRRLPPRAREHDREGGGGAPLDRLDRDSRKGRGDRGSRGARELDPEFLPFNRRGQW